MYCPKCNGKYKVVDSRKTEDYRTWRRKECLSCHHRFITYEVSQSEYGQLQNIVPLFDLANELIDKMGELLEDFSKIEILQSQVAKTPIVRDHIVWGTKAN